jgi:hypothetical protein
MDLVVLIWSVILFVCAALFVAFEVVGLLLASSIARKTRSGLSTSNYLNPSLS